MFLNRPVIQESLLNINEPTNYFEGKGVASLPSPKRVLLFLREDKLTLQKHALQNRSHHRFVLLFNLGTEGHVHLDDFVLDVKPGQALLILPYQFHHFSKLASTELQWLFCTFELESEALFELLKNRVINTDKEMQDTLAQLLKTWSLPSSELQALRLQAGILSVLLSMSQVSERNTPSDLPDTNDNLLTTINQLLANWRGRSMSIEDFANATNYSASRLRTIFKRAAGIPLGSYLKNYRLNRAMALLRTSNMSISEIATETGFTSPQAFSRSFRKETGVTPRSYRSTN